ncbi:MAG: hypothetical protein N3E37_00315 [Candidatus Micrarchaeota archaeon]|nr:hypothetical protein [Candidatus Micrarchaeota archaeon]
MESNELEQKIEMMLSRINELYDEVVNLNVYKRNSYDEFVKICADLLYYINKYKDTSSIIWNSNHGHLGLFIKIMELEYAFFVKYHRTNALPWFLVAEFRPKIRDVAEDILMSYKEEYCPIPGLHEWCRQLLKYLNRVMTNVNALEYVDKDYGIKLAESLRSSLEKNTRFKQANNDRLHKNNLDKKNILRN